MPAPDCEASSFSVVARPPRVGSRRQWMPGTAATIAATRPCSAAVSERIVVSKLRFSRSDMIATPWSPIVPLTRMRSPGRARSPEICTPSGTTPTPVVVMKTPSPLPFSTTLVSPVTMGTPASLDAAAIDSTMRFRSASAKPSSRMKPAARYSGTAPDIATSLIVPCTDRQPMSPPGKNSGETTWLSVAITRRPGGTVNAAWSLRWRSHSLSKARRNSSSISCAIARPPPPCERSTQPCLKSTGRM